MTAILVDPVYEVITAAQLLLSRRTGAAVTLVDPVDLGGSGRTVVLRVRVMEPTFQLPRTVVIKQVRDTSKSLHESSHDSDAAAGAFLREAASYQFATALASDSRPGPDLLAIDLDARLLVLSDLADSTPFTSLLRHSDHSSVTNSLMAMAQALGRMHAATFGREDDFAALLKRVGVTESGDGITTEVLAAVDAVPRMLVDELGLETPSTVIEYIRRCTRLFGQGGLRAFSPADLCPDNILVDDDGVRFLDYEWGGFRDATLDIAYPLASYPACLCNFELSADRSQAMVEAWRAEVVGIWPLLADDAVLATKILDAQTMWVWMTTFWFLPNDHTRIAAARTHHLSIPRLDALISRWTTLSNSADRVGNSELSDFAHGVSAALGRKREQSSNGAR